MSNKIELETMTINNKKLSKSIFKQIPSEAIIKKGINEFIGKPIAKINYTFDNLNNEDTYLSFYDGEKISIIWIKNNELRRCTISNKLKEHEDIGHMIKELFNLKQIYLTS